LHMLRLRLLSFGLGSDFPLIASEYIHPLVFKYGFSYNFTILHVIQIQVVEFFAPA
jgi:hypothetical protein